MTQESSIARSLPHSLEAEEYLLSCCLLDGAEVISKCVEARITAASFYDTKHGIIFQCAVDLYNAQKTVDASVVAEELKTRRQLDQVGGYAFITQVSGRIPTTAQVSYFIEKVREQAMLREIVRSATGVVEDCYLFSGGIDDFVDAVEKKVFAVTQNRVRDNTRSTRQLVQKTLRSLTNMIHQKGQITGLASGFTDLDRLTWGFQPSDVIILAARPSMGKTSLALNIAETVALPRDREKKAGAVLIFSLEMGADQLMQRLVVSRARVNLTLLRNGLLSRNGDEQMRITEAAGELAASPIIIDDTSGANVLYIRAKARRIHQQTPLAFIVVDYLQLMSPTNGNSSREQQVAEASRGLKALAKDLNVPVLVLSQLNRKAETEKRRPNMSDLRESGSIEQDADIVILMGRPQDADDKFQVASDTADVIVAKQRNGPVGDFKLTFLRDITRFENFIQ